MTLAQTVVDIPENRRLNLNFDFEVPRDIPTGSTAQFNVVWFPNKNDEKTPEKVLPKGKIGMTRKELDEFLKNAHTPHTDALSGLLEGMGNITKEQIREMRLKEKYGEYFE